VVERWRDSGTSVGWCDIGPSYTELSWNSVLVTASQFKREEGGRGRGREGERGRERERERVIIENNN